jgi:hypothetical protein
MPAHWTRRQMLRRGGAAAAGLVGLGLAGFIGYEWPRSSTPADGQRTPSGTHPSAGTQTSASASSPAGTDSFLTVPGLNPPAIKVTQLAGAPSQPEYIFVAPRGYLGKSVGTSGLMIVDRTGELVWFGSPVGGTPLNFACQQYQGKPVLTWSAGYVNKVGVTYGKSYIADSSYKLIHTVQAGNGAETDLHEFNLTPQGTALMTAHRKVATDLTSVGGPAKGYVLASIAQEVDVATGKVVFEWDSLDHIPLSESQVPLMGSGTSKLPYDFCHMNSIALHPDGGLVISCRNTSTVYKIARPSGKIEWRLGGKKSDFTMGPGATFYWQHDARMPGADLLTLFDDGSSPPKEKQSRAIVLQLDTGAMRAKLKHAYTQPGRVLADNQGSTQLLPDGRVFAGWGSEPYFSEFASDGELLLSGEFPLGDQSYRAYTFDWSGQPAGRPAVAVRPNPARGSAVYVSWNGATAVRTWEVHAGAHPSALAPAGSQDWGGFETMVPVTSEGPYFMVVARDGTGRELGRSQTVRVTTG